MPTAPGYGMITSTCPVALVRDVRVGTFRDLGAWHAHNTPHVPRSWKQSIHDHGKPVLSAPGARIWGHGAAVTRALRATAIEPVRDDRELASGGGRRQLSPYAGPGPLGPVAAPSLRRICDLHRRTASFGVSLGCRAPCRTAGDSQP